MTDSYAVTQRSHEEGIGEAIAAKVLTHYRRLVGQPGAELRLRQTTLYTSIYRFDDEMLANPHVHGLPAAQGPALHLTRGELFTTYEQSFERVWEGARPWPASTT